MLAMCELLQKHQGEVQTFGLGENDLRELLLATLACNIFQFDEEFYAQKRGLAMGLRISPLLAIVYLDRIERKSLISGILFYKRYIDDVFVISSNADELHIMLENLNECDPNVKFTSELPDEDGFLPFLNTKVRIYQSKKQFRWYKKPQSKNILLHSRSAHPLYMEVDMVRNFVVTKKRTCSEDSEKVDESVKQILEDNEYTTVEA
ncbi:hypothetical protein Y032_0012g1652 [Ancylostoma ceylanicum]|uniref:Reverse transcriptase domain-containing protein n=1 Tax=Ancylostoma ceylanicum TaxID=53326 RepID=A0A016VCA8_9BILA|nr:hypothetical protein Y032_0012g1652 [Ancylostoma ceylanicum]